MNEYKLTSKHIQLYADHLRLEEKGAAPIEKYLRDVRAFGFWLDGREISKENTAAWKAHLVEQGYAPASVNAMLSALNSLLEFLGLRACRVKFLKIQRRMFRDDRRDRPRPGPGAAGPAAGGHLRHRHPGQRGKIPHRGGSPGGPGGDLTKGQDPYHPHPRKTVP